MKIKTFHDLFRNQVASLYATAFNEAVVLPCLRRAANSSDLKEALEEDYSMVSAQADRLSQLMPAAPEDAAMPVSIANLTRSSLIMSKYDELSNDARDAALIDLVRRLRHEQIAGLSTARTWARAMRDSEAVSILEDCLREEKQSDERLEALGDQCCRRAISCSERCMAESFGAHVGHA